MRALERSSAQQRGAAGRMPCCIPRNIVLFAVCWAVVCIVCVCNIVAVILLVFCLTILFCYMQHRTGYGCVGVVLVECFLGGFGVVALVLYHNLSLGGFIGVASQQPAPVTHHPHHQ